MRRLLSYCVALLLVFVAVACDTTAPPVTEPEPLPEPILDADAFSNDLVGTWRRTTYPHGTIHFRKDSVQFAAGEGARTDPPFQPYILLEDCDSTEDLETVEENEAYLNPGNRDGCSLLVLRGDSLNLHPTGDRDDDPIRYTRIE